MITVLKNIEKKKIKKWLNIISIKITNIIENSNSSLNLENISEAYISYIILKNFVKNTYYMAENNKTSKHPLSFFNSDDIITRVIHDINQLFIFLEVGKIGNNFFEIYVNNLMSVNSSKDRLFIYEIIAFLIKKNLIKKNTMYHRGITPIFLLMDVKPVISPLKLNEIEPKYIKVYKIGKLIQKDIQTYQIFDHFSTIYEIYRPNIHSDAKFQLNSLKNLKKIGSVKIHLDSVMINKILNIRILEFNKVFRKNSILNKLNIESIEKTYSQTIEAYCRFIKDPLKNLNLISNCNKELNKLLDILYLNKLLSIPDLHLKNIYLAISFDFRGRFYYLPQISPTMTKDLRYSFHYGFYNDADIRQLKIHDHNEKIENLLNKEIKKTENKLKFLWNFDIQPLSIKQAIIWIILSIGKLVTREKSVSFSQFIDRGVDLLIKNREKPISSEFFKDIDVYIEFTYLLYVINEINDLVYIKRPISKDATASVFQHLIKLLDYTNERSLTVCNMMNEEAWFDTYSIIIEDFIENIKNHKIYDEKLILFFNRKSLKKTIMTTNYSAGVDSCYADFVSANNLNDLSSQEKIKLRKLFNYFYEYVKELKTICKNDFSEFALYFENLDYKISQKDSISNIKYYLSEIIQYERIIKTEENKIERISKKVKNTTNNIDRYQTKLALRANYIHTQDSAFARWMLYNYPMVAIHDCFLVDYLNITYVISLANTGMSEINDINLINNVTLKKIYSPFILI
jgi:hypothetical protein